jgi:glycosyltransferase involved in cell wall biosynthesis
MDPGKRIRVTLASRCAGAFWSIEVLFANIARAFPDWVQCTPVTAPRGRANLGSILANLRWAKSLRDGDIIHQTGDIHYAVLAVWRCPVVLTIHDLRLIDESHGLKRLLFWLWWLYLPCLRADRITVISEFTKSRVVALGRVNPAKVRVIPNCVAPEFTARPKSWPTGKPQLLLIGTTENKNLSRVVEACAGLTLQLCILGKLTIAQRAHLEYRKVEYECHCDLHKEQVVALYATCDLVVFVSTYEGFGMPIIEAQAIGRPVLTADISPMREVAGDGALKVDPFDVAAIRAGLVRLLEEPELREQLVQHGFRNVAGYSATSVAAQYAALYREVVEQSDVEC